MKFWAPALALAAAGCATTPAPPPPSPSVAPEVTELRSALTNAVAQEVAPAPPPRADVDAAVSIPIPQHASVRSALALFSGEMKSDIQDSLTRSARYRTFIEQVLGENGLPKALAYLPVIESAYSETMVSSAGARGMWQFMPETAREYGLRVDKWIDERCDPDLSTRAAAAYLKDLYRDFHDWPLAIAAYNAGAGRIHRALDDEHATTFWQLLDSAAVSKETRGYVPTFFATVVITSDPASYGFRLTDAVDPNVKRIEIAGPLSLRALAKEAKVSEASLRALNPRLVHLAIGGYGTEAPDAARPGYDFVIQAESGLMSITGAADEDGGQPTKVGVPISDVVAGLQGAVAILAALVARGAAPGSPGQRIDVSLLGSTLAMLVNQAQNAFVGGEAPGRLGNAHPNIVPYQAFDTADGAIAAAVGSERQWPRFCRALGLPALADEPRFATNGDRVANRDELIATLAARFAERTSAEWLAVLDAAEVPAGPINDIAAAFESPWAGGRTVVLEHPRFGPTRQVRPPFELAGTPASVRTPPPLLGEQTDEILAEIGVGPEEAARLRGEGIV